MTPLRAALIDMYNGESNRGIPMLKNILHRYADDTGTDADYIVVELAKHLLGPDWMEDYVARANAGGIERILL